ncbi:brix domain-containing protein, putative [Entamoeba dispar SAW760]|uniref:Ribosome production factor 2 homolog n=1 Tax=Entamoeba dispar (strain ATCC PRA-260 / SAW760) TaxID=370354 RepID=B0E726_ENTDS|nr:brix domain-containing protein, putative [Entamoeba dispar SAW760]EDR29668.1 brix domain-containing protein, putative [Entamoeba dispar SAW760]|eukprot:EDR29668.1 brix domain-containing protein, putative [Entamoeba dispar SAW760]
MSKTSEPKKSFHRKKGWKRLERKEPKVIENTKTAIFIKGRNTSKILTDVCEDLALYKKPHVIKFNHKHEILPFEDERPLEVYSTGRDASLLVIMSHNKKRPNCLTFVRMFDGHVLDMEEMLVKEYKPIHEFEGVKPPSATRLMYSFNGSEFETNEEFKMFKNMIIDFYHNDVNEKLVVDELTAMMVFTVVEGKIYMTVYYIKATSTSIESHEVGPRIVMVPGRNKFGAEDMREEAMRVPQELVAPKKKKNVSKDMFGQTIGRVHAIGEDLEHLNKKIKLPKALRESKKEKKMSKK